MPAGRVEAPLMRWSWILVPALCLLAGCPQPDPNGNDGGDTDAGADDGGTQQAPYAYYGITGSDAFVPLDMAISEDGRVGIAYFAKLGTQTMNFDDYELRYVEWNNGQISQPEDVRMVQRISQVSLAFQADGQPAIGYLGGDAVTPTGMSQFWLQSDASISRRSSAGTWTEEVVAKNGDEAIANDKVSDRGFLVGLNTALVISPTETFLLWRDAHDGQFPQQDWNGSDLEVAAGQQGAWTKSVVIAGGMDKQAYGGHIHAVLANGQPAAVSDQQFGGSDSSGQNLLFSRRKMDGTWGLPVRPIPVIGDTQSGPSLAYEATYGYALAVVDRTQDALYFTHSTVASDGAVWSEPTPIYQSGTGGWYPSTSINPTTHEPSVVFYVCSKAAGANEGSCIDADDELRMTERIGGVWRAHTVDEAGGWRPRLQHFSNGKRAVAYRDPKSGAIKLAVEK